MLQEEVNEFREQNSSQESVVAALKDELRCSQDDSETMESLAGEKLLQLESLKTVMELLREEINEYELEKMNFTEHQKTKATEIQHLRDDLAAFGEENYRNQSLVSTLNEDLTWESAHLTRNVLRYV